MQRPDVGQLLRRQRPAGLQTSSRPNVVDLYGQGQSLCFRCPSRSWTERRWRSGSEPLEATLLTNSHLLFVSSHLWRTVIGRST